MSSNESFLWKPHIITLTEHPSATAKKCDASFFPPVSGERLAKWEADHTVKLPEQICSYLLQSDGLEAQRGELWPVLPLSQWEVIHDECRSAHPWARFGESGSFFYLLALNASGSIYRYEKLGEDREEFFAANFGQYLKQVFQGKRDQV